MKTRTKTMSEGLNQVWQTIGCDVLQAVGEGDESVSMTGKEVGEIVADYAETYLPDDLKKQWRDADHKQHHVWLREAFPKLSLYGF